MFWLIETPDQLNKISKELGEEIYLNVVPYNDSTHPKLNQICSIFLKTLFNDKGYMLTISHNDAFGLQLDAVKRVLSAVPTAYTNNKKQTLHYIFLNNLVEISHEEISKFYTNSHKFYYKTNSHIKDLNRIIPITKHFELNENLYENVKNLIGKNYNKFFDHKANLTFYYIESQGIKVDVDKFNQHFPPIQGDTVYTQYNLNTLTKRPSNHFNNINYAALNKSNGERESFIPKNDVFIDVDISAYHPTLLAQLIGYEFKGEDIHLEFSKLYGVSYDKSKDLTFKQMYGGVFKQFKHLEFFQKMEKYTEKLWDEFNNKGYIECPISNYKFFKDDLDEMNPQKLLNYQLQNYETSLNIQMMWEMIPILNKMNTKLILYVYDSFLFDFDKNEIEEFSKIIKIFKKYKLKVKYKKGKNYNF